MSSWDLIGWVIIVLSAGSFAIIVGRLSRDRVQWWLCYWKTQNLAPAVGQEWARRDGYTLYVDGLYDNGRIGVTTKPFDWNPAMHVSWGEDLDEFRRRTREGRYVMVRVHEVRR